MQQENSGLTGLFIQLEEIISGFGDSQMTEAFQNYQNAYNEYTSAFGQMEQGNKEIAGSEQQNNQTGREQYSLALDEAYSTLNTLIQDKVTEATDIMKEQNIKTANLSLLMCVIMLGIGVIITHITLRTIIKPLKSTKVQLEEIIIGIDQRNGDLTKRIQIRNQDELGALVHGINQFIEHLQKTMEKVKQESNRLGSSVKTMNGQVGQSKEDVMNIAAIMEELSAGMEEVTATTEQFGTGINNVTDSVDEINKQVDNGHQLSQEIKERSNGYQINALQGKEMTSKMIEEIRSGLAKSLEESKSVEKIKELTQEILAISSQTNLLALNASIEAARAGEAGAGFTVVAEQIRNLADSSRETANDIQDISELVMDGVASLANDSTRMIEYVDGSILKDYEQFVRVTAQYNSDAESVNTMIGSVATNATTLANTMKQMQAGVNEIVTTINESTKGITDTAATASGLVDSMEELKHQADANQEIGNALKDEVDIFKKITV